MKKLTLVLLSCFTALSLYAQDNLKEYGYIFQQFEKGTVRQKGGVAVQAQLNYDMIGQQMQYLDGKQVYTLVASDVLVVMIEKRRFVPASSSANTFYEEIQTGNGPFYVQHKINIAQKGKDIGFGMTSQTTAASNMGNAGAISVLDQLESPDRYDGHDATTFHLDVNGRFRAINNIKNLTAIFKSHKAELEKFAQDNNTDFKKEADVASIVEYAYGLDK